MIHRTTALILIIWCFMGSAAAESRLRFTAVDGMRQNNQAVDILEKAYSRLGIQFAIVYLTPNRSIQEVENGAADGELVRIKQIGDHFTEIVRVEVPILSLPIYAYTNDEELIDLRPAEMAGVRVGHVAGAKFAERLTAKLPNVTTVETPEVLFNMLQKRRLDVVIAAEPPGDQFMAAAPKDAVFKGRDQLQSVDFYHYLNRRHLALVPRLERALTDLMYGGASAEIYMER